ncbi:MAG: UbiD family decarboxylase [Chloroflexi bacterium]|nr:UbiD family decarboxylase [Chloroflexota bacterium]
MAYYEDLREYLEALDKAGMLRTVTRLINKDTELHPLVRWQFRGLEESQRTGFLFENLTDVKGRQYNASVATAVIAANREMYAVAMRCEPDQIGQKWVEAYRRQQEPRLVDWGPVKEEIHKGEGLLEHGGLWEFPIPMATNGWEGLPRLTAVSWHSKDPDTGVTNVGTYNGTLVGPLRTSCRVGTGRDFALHWRKCRARGIPLQAAAVLGAAPAVSMVSVTRLPYGMNELAVAGGIMGRPLEVVKCETVDLEVPASAEVVLEGEVPPDYLEPDAASGEHTGYTILSGMVNAFHIKCITHRKRPIWHDYISQMPPSESSTIRGIGGEGMFRAFLQTECGIPQVKDVAFHHCAGGWRICSIQLQNVAGVRTAHSTVWRTLYAALAKSEAWPKLVIVVDEDIDPHDLESVLWAMSFRWQPERDTRIVGSRARELDQSVTPYGKGPGDHGRLPGKEAIIDAERGSSMLVDATRKWDYTPIALPKREYMERARTIWEELGYPALRPRVPWFGTSLGIWPDEYEEQARLAEAGEFEKVAALLLRGAKRV